MPGNLNLKPKTEIIHIQNPMQIPIMQIDAFTQQLFKGNPAAVCLLDKPAEPDWMQNVAMEMNLSETAFVDVRVLGDRVGLGGRAVTVLRGV